MHQPNYREPGSNRLVMPWVRLHALKDYLDMPLTASRYEKVKVTFNLVPSLLDQIDLYIQGGTDTHLELSRVKAEELNEGQRVDILRSFFAANPSTMITPHRRFDELYRKVRDNFAQPILPALFTSEELRDLQVWSNLAWVDPVFKKEEPIRSLFDKGRHFSEEEKHALLDWQIELMKRIVPTYRKLLEDGRIDVSFTPYYHPILPLLCDTNSALEAMPKMSLPQKQFAHPEDAQKQIVMAMEKYEALFGVPMKGMWPSEGSVSEQVARIMTEQGVKWIATDEEILYNSLKKSGMDTKANPIHAVYEYGSGLKMFFRDHLLSDRIGFVYSGMKPEKAVNDFVSHVHKIRELLVGDIENTVIPVILDGENAWEYFPDDGQEFLKEFYQQLNDDPLIETVTMSDVVEQVPARKLPSLFAGSWINHNFRIWIGHPEDNAAWDLLTKARETLVAFEEKHRGYDAEKIASAWNQIYIAEGSDWCWWYGDEHRGAHNEEFDRAFRRHLVAVYELLGLEIPFEFLKPIYRGEAAIKAIPPDEIITPVIDGRLSHFYEWSGAGFYDCHKAGGAMHRVDRNIAGIYFAYDYDSFYIRLDFSDKKNLELVRGLKCRVTLFTPEAKIVEFPIGSAVEPASAAPGCVHAMDDMLEVAIKRKSIFENGHGNLGFKVALVEEDNEIESWPETDAITFDIPEEGLELFWPR